MAFLYKDPFVLFIQCTPFLLLTKREPGLSMALYPPLEDLAAVVDFIPACPSSVYQPVEFLDLVGVVLSNAALTELQRRRFRF